jgi:pSer/pThr/pTyr-binding forkhead associated (FHA) protein/tetratricopeptide (TPR) repeat protein
VGVYTLVVRSARGSVVASVPIGREPATIGRGNDCTVVLPSTAVSRKHASVYTRDDGQLVIQDEGSANGVKVDGAFIKRPTLVSERNQIEISEFTIRFEPVSATDQVRSAGKRRGRGASAPAAEVEPEEQVSFDTMLELHAGAALALARSELQLVGRGGPYDGTTFKLGKPLMTVGRTGESDLALDDPSISRRHAQIRISLSADSITVLDLRSSNGTFIDGERVKRGECKPGQVVRFGDLPFRLTREERQAKQGKRLTPGKRIALALSVVLVLVGGVAVVAYVKRPKPPPPVTITPEQRLREIQAEAQRFVDEGRRRLEAQEWTAAVSALDKAKEKDPINADVPKLRQLALDELKHERIWKRGLEYFSLGNRENLVKAKEIFAKVPSTSVYHRDVRYKVKSIDQRLGEDYRVEGVTRCQKRYWDECQVALCRFFELMPAEVLVPGESRLAEMLESAEKKLGRKKGWSPCQAKRFLDRGGEAGGKGDDPATKLEEKYEVAELREVLMIYLGGKIDPALKKLVQAIAMKTMRPHLAQLREVNRQLLIIKGKYQEGYSSYRERKVADAQREWDLVLQADAAILPDGVESFYRREVVRMLGDLYYELGDEQFKAGRFRQAYDLWNKGKIASPRHDRLLNGMLQLEKTAERLIREGQALSAAGNASDARTKLELARDITENGRPTHGDAEKALGELQ